MAEKKKGTRRANGESAIYLGKDGRWHARVPMGYKDNGEPYRRHLTRKTREDLVEEVKKLENQRDAGSARQPGKPWTVEKWLQHWVENIAKPVVSENTYDGSRSPFAFTSYPALGGTALTAWSPSIWRACIAACWRTGHARLAQHTRLTAPPEPPWGRRYGAATRQRTLPRWRNRHGWKRTNQRLSPTPLMKSSACCSKPTSAGIAPVGCWPWRSDFGRVRRSDCAGLTSTWTTNT